MSLTMLDKYLGVSKQTIIEQHVIPANDNDAFNDNKCLICLEPYDDSHSAVRVLPCNHIFGRQCLQTMIDATNGDRCPLCRAQLFRPAFLNMLAAWDQSIEERMMEPILPLFYELLGHVDALPFGLGKVICWVCDAWMSVSTKSSNPFFYAGLLIKNFTDLRQRNPQLDTRADRNLFVIGLFYTGIVDAVANIFVPVSRAISVDCVVMAIVVSDWFKMTNSKDRIIFSIIMLMSMGLGLLVAAVSTVSNFGIQVQWLSLCHPHDRWKWAWWTWTLGRIDDRLFPQTLLHPFLTTLPHPINPISNRGRTGDPGAGQNTTTLSPCYSPSTLLRTAKTAFPKEAPPTVSSVMDRLPLELVVAVMKELIEYRLSSSACSSEHAEQPSHAGDYVSGFPEKFPANWLLLKKSSISDILNATLSCPKLYHASHSTFAQVLGERTFRYTITGTEDMLRIGEKKEVAPYITTLTIGCAGLYHCARADFQRELLPDLDVPNREQIIKDYKRAVDWHRKNLPSCDQKLAELFRAFPNLTALRVHSGRSPKSKVAWLAKGQTIRFTFGSARVREELSRLNSENVIKPDTIINALTLAKTPLKDFPLILDKDNHTLQLPLPVAHLHTLRITLPNDLNGPETTLQRLASVISGVNCLQDLTVRLTDTHRTRETAIIFNALANHSQLRRVCFLGQWNIYEADLIAFTALHAHSVRCIIIDNSSLFGSWAATLRAVGSATQGTLEYFRATWVRENAPGSQAADHRYFEVWDDDFQDFCCHVDWSKWR